MGSGKVANSDDGSKTRNEWSERARTFENFTEENQSSIALACCIFFIVLM